MAAAWRVNVLKTESYVSKYDGTNCKRTRMPKIDELTDEELQRYYYYLHIIWGVERTEIWGDKK